MRKNKRAKRLNGLGYDSYRDYLASEEWGQIRQKALQRDGYLCVACGAEARCVHHTNYKTSTLAGVGTVALVSLCHSCHRFIEFDKDGTKLTAHRVMKKIRWLCRKNGKCLPGRCPVCMEGGPGKGGAPCKRCRMKQGKLAADASHGYNPGAGRPLPAL
jgi:hypothetical protein